MSQAPSTDAPQPDAVPIRKQEGVAEIFKEAEGRHFRAEEIDLLRQRLPDHAAELDAAEAIKKATPQTVKKVIQEIYAVYPYEKHHEHATAKCVRDVTYVVTYAVASMIARDPDWFRDKLLLWMKTIIQSFDYPDRDSSKVRSLMFKDRKLESEITKRPSKAKSIYHTYYLLDQKMSKELSKEHYELFRSYLQQATDVLSDDYGP